MNAADVPPRLAPRVEAIVLMHAGQVLTRFTMPVVYLYLDRLTCWFNKRRVAESVPVAAA